MARNTDKRAVLAPRFSLAWPCVAGAIVLAALCGLTALCVGCSKGAASTSNTDASAKVESIFAEREQAVACPAECVETAISIARAGLGLDPAAGRISSHSAPEAIFESLDREARPIGSTILRVPVADVLAKLSEGPMPPAILVNRSGHLYALFGAFRLDGKLMPQIVHGSESPSVVSEEAVLNGGFTEAWLLHKRPDMGVPIRVGSSTVEISELWHNFGETPANKPRNCWFWIRNRGPEAVVLGRPRGSCTCTVADLGRVTTIGPGKALRVAIQQVPNAGPKNTIELPLFEKRSDAGRRVNLAIIASQPEPMGVVPAKLDFGHIGPGQSESRMVSLVEKPADRFVVTAVDVRGLPIAADVAHSRDYHGLATYRVRLSLTAGAEAVGDHSGIVAVGTDSHVRQVVEIPVHYYVVPPLDVVPSIIAVGTVSVGERFERTVEFCLRDGGPLEINAVAVPAACSVERKYGTRSGSLVVTGRLTKPGIWQSKLRVRLSYPSGSETVEIPCVGYCRT